MHIDHNLNTDANGNAPRLVTIITVVYNNAEFFQTAIESVLSQNYCFIEYIVIDGGSTDGTIDLIKKFRNKILVFVS